MTTLAFIDTETTGLDPDQHEVWEVALILRAPAHPATEGDGPWRIHRAPQVVSAWVDDDVAPGIQDREYVWQLPVDLGRADAKALDIGRFHERRHKGLPTPDWAAAAVAGDRDEHAVLPVSLVGEWAARFAKLTWGAHLVGAVPSFDEERLRRLLRRHGACPGWHYHLIDVEALAVGALSQVPRDAFPRLDPSPPWKSELLSRALGVIPDDFDRHTALGDARWARAIYDTVMA